MAGFADLPEIVLGPLADRPDAHWYAAPLGKWSAAQIVEHLALALAWSASEFEKRRAREPMVRSRPSLGERVARALVLRLGWFTPGMEPPSADAPLPPMDRAAVEAGFRRAVERHLTLTRVLLPARAHDLFVEHPRLGALSFPEWLAFHVRHARHHARQIRARVGG